MKYTKQQLLGAIFTWDSGKYIVIENKKDVQLKSIKTNELYPKYSLEFLNYECLNFLTSLPKMQNYEIY